MSKLNEIQQALTAVEGGRFQKIGDVYLLNKRKYTLIESRGSALGTDKTRAGTPDTIFQTSDDRLVLVQYTTKYSPLHRKLGQDLTECLDEVKTHVAVDSVEGVILVHNSRSDVLTDEEKNALQERAKAVDWWLDIVDVEQLSFDIWQYFPRIAEEFLGIAIDTGQILESDDFVRKFSTNNPTSPLNIPFHFREQELKQAIQQLATQNLLIISGAAGVGKTRFALECCQQFIKQYPSYQLRCVFNRSVPLYRDIRVEVSPSGDYLLLVDDVNRITERESIFSLLCEDRLDRRIKLVLTVRDYALGSVKSLVQNFLGDGPLNLIAFSRDQVKELVQVEFDIHNAFYHDRIIQIARGNARLAVMAAQIAKKHDSLMSIADASALYEEYFSSFHRDGHVLSIRQHLIVAGIVAFFRSLDRTNTDYMQRIYAEFGLSEDVFWNSVYLLHDAEVFDLYENEVVKISDQVMSTYLIYKAFFRDRLIDLSIPLKSFFFHRPRAAADAIYPVLKTFQSSYLFEQVRDTIDKIWPSFLQSSNAALQFLAVFWFVRPEETLAHVHSLITNSEAVLLPSEQLCFDPQKSTGADPVVEVLEAFSGAASDHYHLAIQLLLEYGETHHDLLPMIVATLVNTFGFHHDSYLQQYRKQAVVADVVIQKVKQSPTFVNIGIFLALAKAYLHTNFTSGRSEGGSYIFYDFRLQPTMILTSLRRNIWLQLFQLVEVPDTEAQVLDLIQEYFENHQLTHTPEIVKHDAESLLPFLVEKLSPNNYKHCKLMFMYLDLLDDVEGSYDISLRSQFEHAAFTIAQIVLPDRLRRAKLTYEEYEAQHKVHLTDLANKLDPSDFQVFIASCRELADPSNDRYMYQIRSNVEQLLWILAEIKPEQYPQFVETYLSNGDSLNLQPFGIIFKLLTLLSVDNVLALTRSLNSGTRDKWLFAVYVNLTSTNVRSEHLFELLQLYATAPIAVIPYRFDFLLRYASFEPDILVTVARVLLARSDRLQAANLFNRLLPHNQSEIQGVATAFRHAIPVLEEVYFLVRKEVEWADHDASTLNLLLDLDPSFAERYVAWIVQQNQGRIIFDLHYDHSNLWLRSDYTDVMKRVLIAVEQQPEEKYRGIYDCFKSFFVRRNPEQKRDPVIEEHIQTFLESLIEKESHNSELMSAAFEITTSVLPHKRKDMLTQFLKHNQSLDAFENLNMYYSPPAIWGSDVPLHEQHVEFLQSILPLLVDLRFLKHRLHVEGQIRVWRKRIDQELRQQFTETDW